MPSEVILPRVDMDMATGKISKWLVDDGAPVKKGQPLFEIETDKAAMEIEAEASGTIRTLARAGAEDVAVGSVVAWIYREGESEAPAAAAPEAPAVSAPPEALLRDGRTDAPPPPASGSAPSATPGTASPAASNGLAKDMDAAADRARATPLARRLARERGHDIAGLNGTGPRGRVQASDVPGAIAVAVAASATAAPSAPTPEAIAVLRDAPTDVPPALVTPPAAVARAPSPSPVTPPPPAAPATASSRPAAGTVATLRDGAGAPLVLLHGFGADRDGWRPFLQGYGGGRPVLALDLPGHGAAALDGVAGFDDLVDGVEAALLAAELGAFTLVGHSLGGAVAAAVAARGALDLQALVLIAPAGLGPEINGGFISGFLNAGSEASLAPWLRELVADPTLVTPAFVRLTLKSREPALDGQRRVASAVFPDGTQSFSIRADLARVACPVRVIVGTADRIVPARHAEALPGLVALHRLPGVGHMPQIEAREAVQAIIAQASRA